MSDQDSDQEEWGVSALALAMSTCIGAFGALHFLGAPLAALIPAALGIACLYRLVQRIS